MQRGMLDNGQVPRRLDMSSSSALPQQKSAQALRASDLAQMSPADSFYMSATPLQEQKERALRQVLQEEVNTCLMLLLWGLSSSHLAKHRFKDLLYDFLGCKTIHGPPSHK